jgi:hypothetical protein
VPLFVERSDYDGYGVILIHGLFDI